MKDVRSILVGFIALSAVFSLTACGGNDKKTSLKAKNRPANSDRAGSPSGPLFGKSVSIKGEKGQACFQLDLLAGAVTSLGDDLLTVHVHDLDFVAAAPSDNPKFRGLVYSRLESAPLTQKAHHFFAGRDRQGLVAVVPAKNLMSEKMIGLYFNVATHAKCADTVVFANGDIFTVLDQNRRLLRLQNMKTGEVRIYQVTLKNQISLTVISDAGSLAKCGPGSVPSALVRRKFVVGSAEGDDRLSLDKNIANMLNSFVYKFNPGTSATVTISAATLSFLNDVIAAGAVKTDCTD